MSFSPNSKLVQRTIDLNYTNKKRSRSLKWIAVNAVFLVVFVYDLSCKCPGYTSILHYVELIVAGILVANLVQYAISLAPSRAPKLPLSPEQQKLLGLDSTDLDSSFVLSQNKGKNAHLSESSSEIYAASDADLSLSPRSWRAPAPRTASPSSPSHSPHSPYFPYSSHSPPSPHSPHSPPSPHSQHSSPHQESQRLDTTQDYFISDQNSLSNYIKRCEERARPDAGGAAPPLPVRAPPPYQLAAPDSAAKREEQSPQGCPQVWWRLDLDPQRLTQWNQNLRLWIHVTILQRLQRELEAADEALARAGLGEAGALLAGALPPAALRALPALRPLRRFLEPFPDQRYLVRRIHELARGGCLSGYKWDGGGAEWDAGKPCDSELLLHLLGAYLDAQRPPGERPFADAHVLAADAPRAPDALGLVRLARRPPHWALALGADTLEVGRGRCNLLHCLLLLLAAAARREPPALCRLHLGRAGLNMLWVIGR